MHQAFAQYHLRLVLPGIDIELRPTHFHIQVAGMNCEFDRLAPFFQFAYTKKSLAFQPNFTLCAPAPSVGNA
ncbi:hypothetical protein D3C87_1911840 [compost metagenome]